jgi:hypothetical protein
MQSHRLNRPPQSGGTQVNDESETIKRGIGIGKRFALHQKGENVEAAGGSADNSFSRVHENEGGIYLPVLVASNAYQK